MNLSTGINRSIHLVANWQQKDSWCAGLWYYQVLLGIIVHKNFCITESSFDLSSDSSVIITLNSKVITRGKPCIFNNARPIGLTSKNYWLTSLNNSIPLKTNDNIICVVESFNHVVTGFLERTIYNDIQNFKHKLRMFILNKRQTRRKKKAP